YTTLLSLPDALPIFVDAQCPKVCDRGMPEPMEAEAPDTNLVPRPVKSSLIGCCPLNRPGFALVALPLHVGSEHETGLADAVLGNVCGQHDHETTRDREGPLRACRLRVGQP